MSNLEGERPWCDVESMTGMPKILRAYKLDRKVMYTTPAWAFEIAKALRGRHLGELGPPSPFILSCVLAWCAEGAGPRGAWRENPEEPAKRAGAFLAVLDMPGDPDEMLRKALALVHDFEAYLATERAV